MQIPADTAVKRMEVGMGIEPQHEQLLADFGCAAGMPGQCAGAQGMIAAQHDRHADLPLAIDRLRHGLGPGDDFGQ